MEQNSNPSQCERLLAYLKTNGTVNQVDALAHLGIMRLASRVHELRSRGVSIVGNKIDVINRFNERVKVEEYRLEVQQ